MSLNSQQKGQLARAAWAAALSETETRCPMELTIPQWADESGWGAHQPGNNCFGIKCAAGHPGQRLTTEEYLHSSQQPVTEGQEFETFPSLTACFDRHAQLITTGKPYAVPWSRYLVTGNKAELIEFVARIYATDPAYWAKLKAIGNMPDVIDAIDAARGVKA